MSVLDNAYLVDVDDAEGEADVHDDKDEKEDEHVDDHVGHADDDRTRLPPHQTKLKTRNMLTLSGPQFLLVT